MQYELHEGALACRGANWAGNGLNFALFSAHATPVELCPFSENRQSELQHIFLPEHPDDVWQGYLRGVVDGFDLPWKRTSSQSRLEGVGLPFSTKEIS
jgi:isoamylase